MLSVDPKTFDATMSDEAIELAAQDPVVTLGWHEWAVVGTYPGSTYEDSNRPELNIRIAPIGVSGNPKSIDYSSSMYVRLQLNTGLDGKVYPIDKRSVQLGRALLGDESFPTVPPRDEHNKEEYEKIVKKIRKGWVHQLLAIWNNREEYKHYLFFAEVCESKAGNRYVKNCRSTPPPDAEVGYESLTELKVG